MIFMLLSSQSQLPCSLGGPILAHSGHWDTLPRPYPAQLGCPFQSLAWPTYFEGWREGASLFIHPAALHLFNHLKQICVLPAGPSRQRAPPRTALGRWGPRLRHPEPQPRRRCKPARPEGPVARAPHSGPAATQPSLGSPSSRARGGGAPGAGGAGGGGGTSRLRPLVGRPG